MKGFLESTRPAEVGQEKARSLQLDRISAPAAFARDDLGSLRKLEKHAAMHEGKTFLGKEESEEDPRRRRFVMAADPYVKAALLTGRDARGVLQRCATPRRASCSRPAAPGLRPCPGRCSTMDYRALSPTPRRSSASRSRRPSSDGHLPTRAIYLPARSSPTRCAGCCPATTGRRGNPDPRPDVSGSSG